MTIIPKILGLILAPNLALGWDRTKKTTSAHALGALPSLAPLYIFIP